MIARNASMMKRPEVLSLPVVVAAFSGGGGPFLSCKFSLDILSVPLPPPLPWDKAELTSEKHKVIVPSQL